MFKYGNAAASKATTPLKSTTKVQILNDKNDNAKPSNSPSSKKGSYCRECGKKSHTLTRTKSGMVVCKECHCKFTKPKTSSHVNERDKLGSELPSAKPHNQATTNGGSLLEGTYDEEANAAAFAQALAEWRNGGNRSKAGEGITEGNSASCQTATTEAEQMTSAMPEFHTSGSVTYLERLMIRRNRYDPKFLRNTITVQKASGITTPSLTQHIADTAIPSPYNVFYEAPLTQWSAPISQEVDNTSSTRTTDMVQSQSNTDLGDSRTPTNSIKPLAMQIAIREAWGSKEDVENLSSFFLSGVNENKTATNTSECQDNEGPCEIKLNCNTGAWKPEQSIVTNYNPLKPQDADDSDASDDALDLDVCESDKDEWEMDDRITLECLERELQASQLGNNPEQEHPEIINHNSDFEET